MINTARLPQAKRCFYVSPEGDDANDGVTRDQPWQTMMRVNSARLQPGDHVIFQGGCVYAGPLRLDARHNGSSDAPTVIRSLGPSRATIDGGSEDAIRLDQVQHLEIHELNVVGNGRKNGNRNGRGIFPVACRQVTIDGVETSGFQRAGIEFQGCEHLRICRVHAHDNGYAGISSGPERVPWSRHIHIAYCRAINNPGHPEILNNHSGNGIVLYQVDKGLVEYCEASHNGWDMPREGNGPVGIWTAYCRNITIQHNISHHNMSRPGSTDGGGFDLDGGSENCILQYNYSYDNFGCGYLLCSWSERFPIRNNIIRYNISQNDGQGSHASGIYSWAGEHHYNNHIYQNVVFNSQGRHAVRGKMSQSTLLHNNIFILRGQGHFVDKVELGIFQGNVYWNLDGTPRWDDAESLEVWRQLTGQEMLNNMPVGLCVDPRLHDAGNGASLTDPILLSRLLAYRLKSDSPCINAGVDLQSLGIVPGPRDFYGNPLTPNCRPNVGVHQF